MNQLPAYILAVTAGAILCAIALAVTEKQGSAHTIVKMVCGVVMAVIVIRPLDAVVDLTLTDQLRDLESAALAAVEAGVRQQSDLLRLRISQQVQAYILDKAKALGVTLEVEVILSEDDIPVPIGVILTGHTAPAAKTTLQRIIEEDLSIGKEDQIWISNPSSPN